MPSAAVLHRRCLTVVVFEAKAVGAAGCCVAVAQSLQLLIKMVRPRSVDGWLTNRWLNLGACVLPQAEDAVAHILDCRGRVLQRSNLFASRANRRLHRAAPGPRFVDRFRNSARLPSIGLRSSGSTSY